MPAGRRAYWKGYLRLSLVSVGIELFDAEEKKAQISFNQIHKPTGRRINHVKSVQGVGPVPREEIVSGYEIDKDRYITLEPDELDAVKLESKRTIELNRFAPMEDVDARFVEQPYYVVPADEYSAEGYMVIREALAKTGRVGLGQMTHGGKEHLVAVNALGDGLVLYRLRYANEVKAAEEFFGDLPRGKLDKEMVDLASELIERKSGNFDPDDYSDKYATELKKLIARKAKGERIVAAPEPEPASGNVINLMEALRKSLGAKESAREGDEKRETRPRASSSRSRKPTRSHSRKAG
ncbi:MAG: Ku protein [Rhizobiales bacterium]|nr:Ku protein [Hyphomicrobiales bacterium]